MYVLLKRDLYECPDHRGYTGIRDKAGVWPLELIHSRTPIKEAYDPAFRDNYALPFDQAPEFTNECFHDLSLAHLRGKVEQLSEANRDLIERLDIGPHGEDAIDALEGAVDHLRFRVETLEAALKPFVTDWADDSGWTDAACQKDRIVDWFGPSDFCAARVAMGGAEMKEARDGQGHY